MRTQARLMTMIMVVSLSVARQSRGEETSPPGPSLPLLSMDRAVGIALRQNRDVIAAKLEIRAAELDKVAASLYPNPVLSYSMGNLVLGSGNPSNVSPGGGTARPGFFDQKVQSIGVSEVIDVWLKRSARMRAADEGIRYRRLVVADALRDIVHTVRSAFADVVRQASERDLAREINDRYAETVRLSRARRAAGEISEAELGKIELEGLKYQNELIDAEQDFDLSRQSLAALLGIGTTLPYDASFPLPASMPVATTRWTSEALATRPDVLAARAAGRFASASLSAEEREALPDITLGVGYTHSEFLVSGDNPNSLGFSLSAPLPLFDRNQAGIGRAELEGQKAKNELLRLGLIVRREVAEAARRVQRAQSLLSVYDAGGMLKRAQTALDVAEKSYKAGAISLLELLEARRTYVETRGNYLRAQNDYRQSIVDVLHAIGGEPQ